MSAVEQDKPLTAQYVRELLAYDQITGAFTWKKKPARRICVGSVAGSLHDGRIIIKIQGIPYRASRLAWLYMTGEWPIGEVDHKDTVSDNNAWLNLRDVSRKVNQQNCRRANCRNVSGLLGVSQKPWGFMVRIYVDGKQHYLGTYRDSQVAHQVYVKAKRQLHEGNTL